MTCGEVLVLRNQMGLSAGEMLGNRFEFARDSLPHAVVMTLARNAQWRAHVTDYVDVVTHVHRARSAMFESEAGPDANRVWVVVDPKELRILNVGLRLEVIEERHNQRRGGTMPRQPREVLDKGCASIHALRRQITPCCRPMSPPRRNITCLDVAGCQTYVRRRHAARQSRPPYLAG